MISPSRHSNNKLGVDKKMDEWFSLLLIQVYSVKDWVDIWFGEAGFLVIPISLKLLLAWNACLVSILNVAASAFGVLKVLLGVAIAMAHLAFATVKLKRLLDEKNRSL